MQYYWTVTVRCRSVDFRVEVTAPDAATAAAYAEDTLALELTAQVAGITCDGLAGED